jgi:hypothetical protein
VRRAAFVRVTKRKKQLPRFLQFQGNPRSKVTKLPTGGRSASHDTEKQMIVGYVDGEGSVFCAECWRQLAQAGQHPTSILYSEDPVDPTNNFWVVDNCKLCGVEVKHLSVGMLD